MPLARANIRITGPSATRTYRFTVYQGPALLGLPQPEIDALGLTPIPNGRQRYAAVDGLIERDAYDISGAVLAGRPESKGFAGMVIPSPHPAVGYILLENMRLRVNDARGEMEDVPDDEIHPPYHISRFNPMTGGGSYDHP